ncbi:MAG: N-acetylglucosaminyltransferase [Geoglossum umbratile]|nr:MAG: N-acetylglucosaminyltransferase [Geoglossum umbratile]
MMYPDHWDVGGTATTHAISLLRQARDKYGVKLIPINVVKRYTGGLGSSTWAESYTKLLAFNQTQYDRLLSLDSDSTILQHMDELFLLPKVLVAMPRAYWLDPKDRVLSSQIALIQPSTSEFQRILRAIDGAKEGEYDMEIMNNLYRDSALILPHRPYNLLTGEFRSGNHSKYLGNPEEQWDSDKVLEEAKFLHFSDWPRPKPWLAAPSKTVDEIQPKCDSNKTTQAQGCRERELWLGFYSDFTARRKEICGLETVSYLGVLGRRRLSGDALYGSPLRYPA